MISLRVLRRRIRSIQNTAKITKAMEMVATAKMRKAQDQAVRGRPYSEKISQVIADLAVEPQTGEQSPLLEKRPVQRIYIIHITSDRGLCGGLNANMNRLTGNFILEQKAEVSLVTVGRKGREFMRRFDRKLVAEFTGLGDKPRIVDALPIARVVLDDYRARKVDRVLLAYSRFVSTVVQKPVIEQILPVAPAELPKGMTRDYIYEPHGAFVLERLLPRFVEMEVYHAILEAVASEQSARMVAMRNATDAANDIIAELTNMLNKARQEIITKELLEIISGAEAQAKV
jgi:F-type H+-transporting ATPase subunit gamma